MMSQTLPKNCQKLTQSEDIPNFIQTQVGSQNESNSTKDQQKISAEINEMEEKSRDILDENAEKGISSLTVSNFDQEKNHDQCSTGPSGFSDFPPLRECNQCTR